MIIEAKYIGIILSPNLMDLVVFQYLYGGFDAWPINYNQGQMYYSFWPVYHKCFCGGTSYIDVHIPWYGITVNLNIDTKFAQIYSLLNNEFIYKITFPKHKVSKISPNTKFPK